MSSRLFVDEARIFVRAGKGGNGANSLAHDRSGRKSWPDGGPGGKGGDGILKASPHLATLLDFQYQRHFQAEKGTHGSSNQKKGRAGRDLFICVPVGTLVFDEGNAELVADLVQQGQEVCVVRGGEGGKGNDRSSSALPGEPGEEKSLRLELRLLADVGLVGYPNAGKSTLLAAISAAKPKVASYPFTTLIPHLGLVGWNQKSFTAADIPGLIEGAHRGKGLGDEFLRHVARTRILLVLLDMAGTEGRDPCQDYKVLLEELKQYDPSFCRKKYLIVANKMDLPEAGSHLAGFKRKVRKKVYEISAKEKKGLDRLMDAIVKIL